MSESAGAATGESIPARTIFAILLLPAIALGLLSLLTFAARWIGITVLAIGLMLAVLASRRPPTTAGVLVLVIADVVALITIAVLGVMIDCARHCS